ncbi:DUF2796 domain-containing protein [Thalassotalea euphylliae]|uniref:DUF2796 domain-containing protein n=1 Tax=Thalassotalea euphylliae TaxID=1655234 RepID=A0A3E0TTD7_9GAMM|nr:DUF2796 domain-containing protein [Thalassotalea euphylliae]REL27733.1 DUF2796 domain-containing protein [Thalassotalea euphylliae]
MIKIHVKLINYLAAALFVCGLGMPISLAAEHNTSDNTNHNTSHNKSHEQDFAQSHNHHSGLQAHVHGEAELTLVLERQQLHINLAAPAESLLGFEHQAHSQREKNIVKQVVTHLSTLDHVIKFKANTCQLTEQHIDTNSVMPITPTQKQTDRAEHAEHAEITASYEFACQRPKQLTSISLELFTHFKRLTKIHTIWLTEHQQGRQVLTPSSRVLSLR